ncbi:Uncharacterised protein [Halioglobus japonicus]|nr:Uncharacterised protein [Halioglobus japonicus]
MDRFGEPVGLGSHAHPMQRDELLGYLKSIDNFSLSPWVALTGQTEAIGDPATPSREQIAILRWLGKALEIWERQAPLEGRVAAQVRRLKPLSAALAVTDPTFLQPGAHPIHQLLDSIQARAIGWQARLDRVGAILEQQVHKAVEDSRAWFDDQSTNLANIRAEFSAAAERDQARAARMIQRVVEAEAGKIKTAAAKQEAAKMINAALQKHPAPAEIGDFLKGPWYTSAQLLLLKYGAESEQWKKMSSTTEALLDSFQNIEEADEARRQQLFELVTRLPKEMRRWLLSLHHDTEAVNEAMGLVEFAHLRILRKQTLELLHITPITVEGDRFSDDEAQTSTGGHWREGQWFSVENGKDGVVRVQLVLKVEQSRQLLFTNMAGIKVLQLSFSEFDRLISAGKVQTLDSGASFSLCLAHAVGIDSVEILDALVSALAQSEAEPEPESEPEPQRQAEPTPVSEPVPNPEPTVDANPPLQPEPEQEAALQAEPELEPELELTPALDLTPDFDLELDLELEQEPDDDLDLQTMSAQLIAAELDPVGAPTEHVDDTLASLDEIDSSASEEDQPRNAAPPTPQRPASDDGFLIEQARRIKARGGYLGHRAEMEDGDDFDVEEIIAQPADYPDDPDNVIDQLDSDPAVHESAQDLPAEEDPSLEFLLAQVEGNEAEPAAPPEAPTQDDVSHDTPKAEDKAQDMREVNLPMGAWLGFHDGETPLMARLAVYDLENEHYIFVNRQGVKMRQVSRLELLNLIDKGLVDILETRSNFRDEVTEVRKNLDQE